MEFFDSGKLVAHARQLRQELRAAGIKARVRSNRFQWSCGIGVELDSESTPMQIQEARCICDKYQHLRTDAVGNPLEGGNCYVNLHYSGRSPNQ